MSVIEIENADAVVLKLEAQQIDSRLRDVAVKHNRRSMEIGWYGHRLKIKNLWPYLGFSTETDEEGNEYQVPFTENTYRISIRIGRSTWYQQVGLAEKFSKLSLEQFVQMSTENAKILAVYPEEVRYNEEILRKAAVMSEKDLAHELLADKAQREKRPIDEVSDPHPLKIFMTHGQKEAVIKGLQEWQTEHDIPTQGEAIEMLLAEYRGRISLVRYMAESITFLRKTITHCDTPEHLAEVRQELQAMVAEMQEVLGNVGGDHSLSRAA